jgi:pimeloyl-ACP methyl ester carboxylesterase
MGRQHGQPAGIHGQPAPILSLSVNSVVFSHGKESGPWGAKITAMAAVARDLALTVESVDYRGMDDPVERVKKLIGLGAAFKAPVVLVGSSMGGHVSAAAAGALGARALFLLAPAFYMPGFEKYTPQDVGGVPTAIVHGWHDDIVPVENSIRWAREHQAALHVLNSDHRLEDQIETICALLRNFLVGLGA